MKVVTVRNGARGRKPTRKTKKVIGALTKFYNDHFKQTVNDQDPINDDKLSYVLAYEAIDIVTHIDTNIKQHFVDHINKFINVKFGWKAKIAAINASNISKEDKIKRRRELYKEFHNIKYDVLNVKDDNWISPIKYHRWLENNKYDFIPHKDTYQKNSIHYDVCANPQDYLWHMIYINKELSECGTVDNPVKLFHVIPLRTSIIPKYVTFDTASLISLFVENNTNTYYKKIKKFQKEIWAKFFRTNRRVPKKTGYRFNYMIKTDGIACSIIFVKANDSGKPMNLSKIKMRRMEELKQAQDKNYIEDQINIDQLLGGVNCVPTDPNKSDLIYCKDKLNNKFRYTQNQRRHETRSKRYQQIRETKSATVIEGTGHSFDIEIDGVVTTVFGFDKTVKEIESELSEYNSKTCDFDEFMDYLKIKHEIDRILSKHYQDPIYRKLKWNTFINTQRSESTMCNNFQEKFGSPEETVVIAGDYDSGGYHKKGNIPAANKRLLGELRKFGYPVYLINEFRTSKLCCKCHCEVETFHKRTLKNGTEVKVWGLVRCTNPKCRPNTVPKSPTSPKNPNNPKPYGPSIFNRDDNAVLNMHYIVKNLIKTGKRPEKYTR